MFASFGMEIIRGWQAGLAASRLRAFAAMALLFVTNAALAGVGISVTPTFPSAVKVGDTYNASLLIKWTNADAPGQSFYTTHTNRVTDVTLTPACGVVSSNSTCDPGFEEPSNPIQILGPGTGSTGCRSANDPNVQVTTFTVIPPAVPGGAYSFSPDFQLLPGGQCQINFQVKINGKATKDAIQSFGGIQTSIHTGATATDNDSGEQAGGVGGGTVSFPSFTTLQIPANATLQDNVNLMVHDTAKIVGLYGDPVNRPTGTITFKLYDPTGANAGCTGVPAFTSGPFNIATSPSCTIGSDNQVNCTGGAFTVTKAGTWRWVADYVSGDARNPNISSGCIEEPVVVNKANPVIQTTPNPTTATKGVDSLSDQAILSAGFTPTGSITFTLFPPSSFSVAANDCTGPSVFTSVVPVNGNNQYDSAVAAANLITETGTYYWKAVYGGDTNNNAAISPCTAEQVVVSKPTILISKTPDAPSVAATINAGEDATFTIDITNSGPGIATAVTLNDVLPSGFTWSIVSVDGNVAGGFGCAINAGTLSCNFGNMPPNTTHKVIVKAPTTLAQCTVGPQLPNGAYRINNQAARATSTNAGTVTDPGSIDCNPPKIKITKTPDAPNVNATITAGQDAIFTIMVGNDGPGVAKSVTLNDALPAGFTWSLVSVNGQANGLGCAIAAGTLNCTIGDIAAGVSHTIIVKAPTDVTQCSQNPQLPGGGYRINNVAATATSTNAGTVTDPGSIDCKPPRIKITKTPDAPGIAATITAGEDAVFTIVVANNGSGTATGVTITDALPAGFTWSIVSVDGNVAGGLGCAIANGSLSCNNVGDMAPGSTHTIIVKAPTTKALCEQSPQLPGGGFRINNLAATVSTTNAGTDTDPGSIDCNPPKILITKTPDAPSVAASITAGQDAVFTIVVNSTGPGIAKGVTLSDALPAGFTWSIVSVDGNVAGGFGCAINAGTLSCDFGTMTPNSSHTVIVKAPTTKEQCSLLPQLPGGGYRINNVAATANSINAGSVNDPGSIDCTPPTIKIVKTPDGGNAAPGFIQAGDTAEFKIVVSNDGPGIATGVKLTDALPSNFTWTMFSLTGLPSLPANNTCVITGGVNLACDFFDMAVGSSRTIIVRAPTTPLTCVPNGGIGGGTVTISNPVARATSTNAIEVTDSGTIICQTANPCDISLDTTCSMDLVQANAGKAAKFECPDPFDGFKMEWDPGSTTDNLHTTVPDNLVVDVRIWNGAIGSAAMIDVGGGPVTGPVMICSVEPGEVVSVNGLLQTQGKKKKPADEQFWEIFPADPNCKVTGWQPTKQRVGVSKFKINCKDGDMKKRDDCGTLQGDGHADKTRYNGFINDWRLAGINGDPNKKDANKHTLQCDNASPTAIDSGAQNCALESPGDNVTLFYTLTNNSTSPITVNLEDTVKPGTIEANIALGAAGSATATRKFSFGPIAVNSTLTSNATLTGNFGQANACSVTDRLVVSTPCLMGDPATGQLYPFTSPVARTSVIFNESEVLRRLEPKIATLGDTIRMWYSDEHAMLLGIRSAAIRSAGGQTTTQSSTVSPFVPVFPAARPVSNSVDHPLTGLSEAQGGVDPAGRPIPPSLFCTDITDIPTKITGDWQFGGTAQNPHFVSGTWKSATVTIDNTVKPAMRVITTDADPAGNGAIVGPGADPVPAGVAAQGYVSEVRWNINELTCAGVPLQKGHTYRLQFMVHDGDQNKTGGDVGQACATVIIPQ